GSLDKGKQTEGSCCGVALGELGNVLGVAREEGDPQIAVDRLLEKLHRAVTQAVHQSPDVKRVNLFMVGAVPHLGPAVPRLVDGVPVLVSGPAMPPLRERARAPSSAPCRRRRAV